MKKIVLLALLFLAACSRQAPQAVLEGFTQGTTYKIILRGEVQQAVQADIDTLFRHVEESMSLYERNSLISRLNRNETDTLDGWIAECLALSQALSRETDGVFDVTIKPLTAAYGFAGAERTEAPNVDSLLQIVGYEKISVKNNRLVKADPRVQIDLNAVAQGYTVDLVARYLDSLGVKNYLVEMGGEVFGRGTRADGEAWRVGIDAPREGNMIPGAERQATIGLSGRGLATSGNYRKFYEDAAGRKIVHTIDPRTGEPVVRDILSATVVAPTAAGADIVATYCMAAGLEKAKEFLLRHPEIDALIVYANEAGGMTTFATGGIE